jgi:hypothetical protein
MMVVPAAAVPVNYPLSWHRTKKLFSIRCSCCSSIGLPAFVLMRVHIVTNPRITRQGLEKERYQRRKGAGGAADTGGMLVPEQC